MSDAAAFPRLILGSSSTYRKELLGRLRLPFDVLAPDIDETALPAESPEATATRLAEQKALCNRLRRATEALNAATTSFAGRRMDARVREALAGRSLDQVGV